MMLISSGTQPERDRAACICSKLAPGSPMGSRGSDGQPHHSCSTFDLECSRETCDRIHHSCSTLCQGHVRHRNLRLRNIRRGNLQSRHLGSCGRCVQPFRTCSIHYHCCHRTHRCYLLKHPQRPGWGIRGKCDRSRHIGSMISPWAARCTLG